MTGACVRAAAWAVLIAAQLAVPAVQIARHERVLRQGERVLLSCRPVDPADPLRGRYVDLAFDAVQAPEGFDTSECDRRAWVYVPLIVDAGGGARFDRALSEPPDGGPYVRARCARISSDGRIDLDLPFRRFFLDETLAPEADRAYRRRADRDSDAVQAAVRVRGGAAVLEQLYFDGVPAREALSASTADRSASTSSERDNSN